MSTTSPTRTRVFFGGGARSATVPRSRPGASRSRPDGAALNEIKVASADQGRVHWRCLERPRSAESAEFAANDDHPVLVAHLSRLGMVQEQGAGQG